MDGHGIVMDRMDEATRHVMQPDCTVVILLLKIDLMILEPLHQRAVMMEQITEQYVMRHMEGDVTIVVILVKQ